MSPGYEGCRRVPCLPHAFNCFGLRAGMSRNLTFDDIEPVLTAMKTVPCVVPVCSAVVLAIAEPPGTRIAMPCFRGRAPAEGMVTLQHELDFIPDVYAFLHAIFHSGLDDAMQHGSVLRGLFEECCGAPQPARCIFFKQAAGLQKVYRTTVRTGIWASVGPGHPGRDPPAQEPGAPARAAKATTINIAKRPAAEGVPRFFVFVRHPATGGVVLIDGDDTANISYAAVRVTDGVLCGDVVRAIDAIRAAATAAAAPDGARVDSCVFALMPRRA